MRQRRYLLIALLFTSSLLVGISPAAVRAADNPSDIPGVPIPGPIATGLLGGPVYDVVYRLSVQPGYVIVAGLTGTAGTDFDLYLFDSTATTVVSNQGLLAKSTGSTSTENLAYPSAYGGTYYIDLNGATDVEGTFTLSVQLVKDSGVPVASLLLADGNSPVDSPTVSVLLTASANLSGVAQMAFSSDGAHFGPWLAYAAGSTWTFPGGDGVKTLWAKVMNGVGTESSPASASVVLDTTPPAIASISPSPTDPVSLRPTYTVRFSEAINQSSWQESGLLLQLANGARISGTTTYDRVSYTATFTPDQDLTAGAIYAVTIGPVRDLAGNPMPSIPSWTVVPKILSSISLRASQVVLAPGASVALTAATIGLDGASLLLGAQTGGSSTPVETGPYLPQAGLLALSLVPQGNTTYSFRFLGTTTTAPSQSNPVRVLVRRMAQLSGLSADVTRTARAGRRITLSAQVMPPSGSVRVSFRLYRYSVTTRSYAYAGSFGRTTDANGRATLSWTPSAGRYYWRVVTFPSPEFANGSSPAYRWTIGS